MSFPERYVSCSFPPFELRRLTLLCQRYGNDVGAARPFNRVPTSFRWKDRWLVETGVAVVSRRGYINGRASYLRVVRCRIASSLPSCLLTVIFRDCTEVVLRGGWREGDLEAMWRKASETGKSSASGLKPHIDSRES